MKPETSSKALLTGGESGGQSWPQNLPDKLRTRAEVEVIYGISRRFLEVAAVRGDGPPMIRIGRRIFYRDGDLREWIGSRRVTSTSQEVGQ